MVLHFAGRFPPCAENPMYIAATCPPKAGRLLHIAGLHPPTAKGMLQGVWRFPYKRDKRLPPIGCKSQCNNNNHYGGALGK